MLAQNRVLKILHVRKHPEEGKLSKKCNWCNDHFYLTDNDLKVKKPSNLLRVTFLVTEVAVSNP